MFIKPDFFGPNGHKNIYYIQYEKTAQINNWEDNKKNKIFINISKR